MKKQEENKMTDLEREKLESCFLYSDNAIYELLKGNKKDKSKPQLKDFIKYTRETLGYTQQEFANWLDIKQNTLSRYENGIRPVPFVLFMDLCHELGYDISIKKREKDLGSNDELVKEYKEEKKQWKNK